MSRQSLGEFEQLVLLAILRLKDDAYGAGIAQELETQANRRVSRGALYSSLDRLEKKGFLRWEVAPATSERGGQPKRCFEVTPTGIEALKEPHQAWLNLTSGLEDILGGPSS
ncbi:MAG TPA: PadR family transcriptional regulator [Acidobacteriota bacterium]|nr:PadR family transcriptional regulator [Acidobacteriota bacterium]